MYDQSRPTETLRPVSRQSSAEERGVSAGTTSNQRRDGRAEESSPQRVGMTQGENDVEETIVFRNHRGDRYIWPYELCHSFDAIKPLLEEAYILLNQQDHVDDIKQGKYEIQTDDGDTILPSVWRQIVKPFSAIQISFSSNDTRRRRQDTNGPEPGLEDDGGVREGVQEVRFDVDSADPPPTDSEGEDDESQDDLETESSAESENELPEQAEPPGPFRDVVPPVDTDGNKLCFTVDTSRPVRPPPTTKEVAGNAEGSRPLEAQTDAPETYIETLRITKAISAEVESRNLIQVHTLPGPENVHLRESVTMTWYHIPSSRLDFTRFRNVCLAIPNISDRLQTLIREILKKIEEHKVKAFLDGMFIEPGTVLRADERGQPDPLSVIFSCVPYFDLHPPARKLPTGQGDRLFPPRTLMQSYYPYEPVRERDAEQAYKKFGNDRSGSVVNVPNLWMMNIGSKFVVTSGYQPLAQDLIRSITVVQEELEQLGKKEITKDSLTSIRLTDWDGRVLLFSLDACRSYFQMEQKVRELKYTPGGGNGCRSLQFAQRTLDGEKKVEPGDWSNIIKRTDRVFIDLALLYEKKAKELQQEMIAKDSMEVLAISSPISSPPFFQWPLPAFDDTRKEKEKTQVLLPSKGKRSMYCLEQAERGMMSETLDNYDTINAVDKTFTSTTFYQSLPERTHEVVRAEFLSLGNKSTQAARVASVRTHHQTVVDSQCTGIEERSMNFFKTIVATFKLFVDDVDTSIMLRKVWGAIAHICRMVTTIVQRGGMDYDPQQDSAAWKHPLMMTGCAWFIRNNVKNKFIPAPEADERFKRSIRRCKICQSFQPYNSPDAALDHLRMHVKSVSQPARAETAATSGSLRTTEQTGQDLTPEPDLKDWVVSFAQVKSEETNAGVLTILTQACETAKDLFVQAKEIAEGVQNEDGKISDLYTLPHQLVEAFREIIVFYLAVERALHHNEESYQKDTLSEGKFDSRLPFVEQGVEVLRRFGEGARRSLVMARMELCGMAASTAPMDIFRHLSLGPEYVCAWFMRRLLVKPLEKRMTVSDMYREYLSTIQFQVNHRPGKRLLRSINLLQEELQVLSLVNTWQTKLIQNYSRVLDDTTYEIDIPSRRAMFPYERMLLNSCLENLALTREEYSELIRRCGPLSDSTKQSLEINEEDHGKAIMVFTVVTVIFLPLSFVTSFLGMNTADIRNMNSQQSLFWIVALPLTLLTMGTCLFIGYNGDELRDMVSSIYRTVTGKQDRSTSSRGISVAQRQRGRKLQSESSSTLDDNNLADEAEYASPRPEYYADEYGRKSVMATYNKQSLGPLYPTELDAETLNVSISAPAPRANFQTQSYSEAISMTPMAPDAGPTYPKINRRYLDAESIRFYGLPYEVDAADGSFIIKQELSDRELRILFEHTSRMRRGGERGRNRYKTNEVDRYNVPERMDTARMDTARMDTAIPLPRITPFVKEDVDGNGDGERVQEYTWHKKRSRRHPGRTGRTGRSTGTWRR